MKTVKAFIMKNATDKALNSGMIPINVVLKTMEEYKTESHLQLLKKVWLALDGYNWPELKEIEQVLKENKLI